jgi:GntR family transcriptional regulator
MKNYPLERDSAVPLYVQLSDIIKKNIVEGHFPPGSPIPSELQLMKAYDVSRITVRNALLRLEYSGEIFKVHGRGSFVSKKKIVDIPSPSFSWRRLMEEQGYNISFTLIEFCEVWPSEGVQRELRLRKGQSVTKLKRVKKVEQEVIGLDVLFMPLEIGTSLEKMNLSDFSLVEFLNGSSGTKINRIEAQIRAAPIEDGDAEVMGVDPSSTVLIRGFVAFNAIDEPVLSGKIMYLSQYAVIKATVSVESTSLGNSLVDAPGGPVDDHLEAECVPNLAPGSIQEEQEAGRSKNA